jgi:serine/threonine-protein kinase
MTAADRAEAAAAIAAAPAGALGPGAELRPRVPIEIADAFTGRAMLLVGQAADAARFLRVATASCHAFDHPFEHTRAHLWLGRALEATGDTAGACAAYGVVVQRWGKVKPKSVSADEARDRRRALHCAP